MSAAAEAAVLDGLPDIPCMAPVHGVRGEVPDPVLGTQRRRYCVLPNGHGEYGIPCSYAWREERVHIDRTAELGNDF